MHNGDLSNDSPERWIVTLDALLSEPVPKKTRFKSWRDAAQRTKFNTLAIGRLWRALDRGVRFELVTFELPDEYAQALETTVDRLGYPIAWVTPHVSRRTLQASMPYRPDVFAVVDDQEHALMWGYRGISITDL